MTTAPSRLGTRTVLTAIGDWSRGSGASLQGKLVAALAEAIGTGLLPAGAQLPSERSLARDLSVSRSTVTAALIELKAAGLLVSRQGSGTRIVDREAGAPPAATVLPRLLGETGGIDLAASSPADARSLPPLTVDLDALIRTEARHGYAPAGLPELRALIAAGYADAGLPTDPEEVLVSNGAQHALALALTQLTEPGDAVVVDDPTYPGMIDLLAARRLRPVGVTRTEDGFDVDAFRRTVVESGARVAYLQTVIHNPTGLAMDDYELRRLAAVVDELDLTVIEDLVLADLRYGGRAPLPLAARCRRGLVVVVGSVSKLGWGGLRVGWLRGPRSLVDRLVRTRLADDLGSSVPSQVMTQLLLDQAGPLAVSRRHELRARSAQTLAWVAEHAPTWHPWPPAGGLSLWVTLPGPGAEALAQRAQRAGVVIATGGAACVALDGDRHVRLTFDRPEAQLTEGLRRLTTALAH